MSASWFEWMLFGMPFELFAVIFAVGVVIAIAGMVIERVLDR